MTLTIDKLTPKHIAIIALIVAAIATTGILYTRKGVSGSNQPAPPAQTQKVIPEKYQSTLSSLKESKTAIDTEAARLPPDVVQKVLQLQTRLKDLQLGESALVANIRRELEIPVKDDAMWQFAETNIQGKNVWVLQYKETVSNPTSSPSPEKKP